MVIRGRFRRSLHDQRGAVPVGGMLVLAGAACGGVGVGFVGQRVLSDESHPATASTRTEVVEIDSHAPAAGAGG